MFGMMRSRANEIAAKKATEEMLKLGENVAEVHLYIIGRNNERDSISYVFDRKGGFTRKQYEVSHEDAVKFAYLFFFTSVLRASGGK